MIWKLFLQNKKKNLRLQPLQLTFKTPYKSWSFDSRVCMEFWIFDSERFWHNLFFLFWLIDIVSMSVPFKRHIFCQNPMYNCRVISIESWTITHTFPVIFTATAPHPRWGQKPCNGLLRQLSWNVFDDGLRKQHNWKMWWLEFVTGLGVNVLQVLLTRK